MRVYTCKLHAWSRTKCNRVHGLLILYIIIFWRILLTDNDENLLESDVDLSENYADLSYVISICQKIMTTYHICYVDLSENYPNLSDVMSKNISSTGWIKLSMDTFYCWFFFEDGENIRHDKLTNQFDTTTQRYDTSTYPDSKQSLGQRWVIVGIVGNTSLLACWHWPNIGPTLKF